MDAEMQALVDRMKANVWMYSNEKPWFNFDDAIRILTREGLLYRWNPDGEYILMRWNKEEPVERIHNSVICQTICEYILSTKEEDEPESEEEGGNEEMVAPTLEAPANVFEHPDLSYEWEGEEPEREDILELYRTDNPEINATDAAIMNALALGVSLYDVEGTGTDGVITVKDVPGTVVV